MTKRFWMPHQKDCVHKIHREATILFLFIVCFKTQWGFWNGRKVSEMDSEGRGGDFILGILALSLGIVGKEVWVIMFSVQADLDMTSPANERATFGASLLLLLAAGNRIRGGSSDLLPTSQLMKIWRLLMEIKRFSLWNIKQNYLKSDSLSELCQPLQPELRAENMLVSPVTWPIFVFPILMRSVGSPVPVGATGTNRTVTKSLSKKCIFKNLLDLCALQTEICVKYFNAIFTASRGRQMTLLFHGFAQYPRYYHWHDKD